MSDNDPKTEKIRSLNDAFRKTFAGGQIIMTQGVASLSSEEKIAIMQKVRLFEDFEEANDPYGEHDFGAFEHNGEKFLVFGALTDCNENDTVIQWKTQQMISFWRQ